MILCLFALWRLLGRQENPVCNAVFRFNFYFPRSNYCLFSTICCTQYQSMLLFCLISILNLIRIDPLLWLVNCVKGVKVVNSCQKLLWALLTPRLCYAAFNKSYSQGHCLHHLNLHGLSQQTEIWQHSRSHPVFLLSQTRILCSFIQIWLFGGYPLLHISEDQQKKTSDDMSAKCFSTSDQFLSTNNP